MAEYYNDRSLLAGVNAPQMSVGDLTKAGSLVQQALGSVRDRELQDAQIDREQKRWDITNARAEAQEKRAADEYERSIRERQATNDALKATINPEQYKADKMVQEQKAVEEAYKLMSPEEVKAVKAQYDPTVSGRQWLDVANNATGVDVGKVLDTKSRQYEIAAKTPGTPEYIAAKKSELDLYRQKAAIDSGNRLAELKAENAFKTNGMLNVLGVGATKQEDYTTNDALRKNIEAKQETYGNTYKTEIDKNLPTIESTTKNTEALKDRLTGNETLDKGLLKSIKTNEDKLAAIYDNVDKMALGKAGMGNAFMEVPETVKGTRDVVKSKEEFTKDMLKALGPNPSVEAVVVATQEIEKRYPKTNLSVAGYNQLAEQYGGKAVFTNDPAVAKENADASVQIYKEKLNKQLMLNPISVDDTNKSLSELFKISSPDVMGTGDENKIRDKVYQIKAQYQIPDKQMGSMIDQSRKSYLDPLFGVNEDFVKEIEQKAAALKGTSVKTNK